MLYFLIMFSRNGLHEVLEIDLRMSFSPMCVLCVFFNNGKYMYIRHCHAHRRVWFSVYMGRSLTNTFITSLGPLEEQCILPLSLIRFSCFKGLFFILVGILLVQKNNSNNKVAFLCRRVMGRVRGGEIRFHGIGWTRSGKK